MHTAAPPLQPHHLQIRPPLRDRLQLTVIENDTGRRICSFPSGLHISEDTDHLEFEDEAWQRAVLERRVAAAERARYSIELR